MKRYEKFNEYFNNNETIEEQALGMLLFYIEDTYWICSECLSEKYNSNIEWLKEEAKVVCNYEKH